MMNVGLSGLFTSHQLVFAGVSSTEEERCTLRATTILRIRGRVGLEEEASPWREHGPPVTDPSTSGGPSGRQQGLQTILHLYL